MEKLIFVLLFVNSVLFAQKHPLQYPQSCLDSIKVEEICLDCAEDYFFGGKFMFEKYLYVNLYKSIIDGEIPSGSISLVVNIDSLGISTNVLLLSKIDSCQKCNDLIIKTIKSVDRWKSYCNYSIFENKIICEAKQIRVNLLIKNNKIYINEPTPLRQD